MSLQFNDTTDELGIVQEMDTICNSNSTNHPLKVKARRVNAALDSYIALALRYDNFSQFDDKNFSDLPISTFDLFSGQRSYKITDDENGNEIIKVHKVFVKNSTTGDFIELDYVDESDKSSTEMLLDNTSQTTGIPKKYNWFANSIFFDPIPSYSSDEGVKIIYQRTSSYFTSTDTTKEPGIPGVHHLYIARKASLPYLVENGRSNKNDIAELIRQDEEDIKEYFINRSKDRHSFNIKPLIENNR